MSEEIVARRSSPRLAIVLPCFNERESLDHVVDVLSALTQQLQDEDLIANNSFLYFVDDGSNDGTWKRLEALHERLPALKGLRLSKNFGHQAALLAGLTAVVDQCDAAVSIDADLQQDPFAIREFVREFKKGRDVVLGVRRDRGTDGWMKKQLALGFYGVMNAMGVNTVRNHADYRLLSQRALRALLLFRESNIFLRATCLQLGFPTAFVQFDVRERRFGSTKYSLKKMLRLALHGITSSSVFPLRLVAYIGSVLFLLSLTMAAYVAWRSLYVGDTVPGWASITLPLYFIGGVQLLCLGVVGEYVGQIYATVRNRPRWIAENELE